MDEWRSDRCCLFFSFFFFTFEPSFPCFSLSSLIRTLTFNNDYWDIYGSSRVRLHGWHSSVRTTRLYKCEKKEAPADLSLCVNWMHPAMRPKYTSQIENFWIFTIESFATRTLMLLILCLEDDLAAWKLSAKPPHIFVSLHSIRDTLFTHSSHFSPSTGGTCCERWNTMLLELYPRVGYVSPHTVKDGWTWLRPPQHLELLCEVLCVCVCSDKVAKAAIA